MGSIRHCAAFGSLWALQQEVPFRRIVHLVAACSDSQSLPVAFTGMRVLRESMFFIGPVEPLQRGGQTSGN